MVMDDCVTAVVVVVVGLFRVPAGTSAAGGSPACNMWLVACGLRDSVAPPGLKLSSLNLIHPGSPHSLCLHTSHHRFSSLSPENHSTHSALSRSHNHLTQLSLVDGSFCISFSLVVNYVYYYCLQPPPAPSISG